jgi:hypothetical protein
VTVSPHLLYNADSGGQNTVGLNMLQLNANKYSTYERAPHSDLNIQVSELKGVTELL